MGNFISKQISKPAARVGIAVFIAAYLYHMSTKKSKHDKRQFKTTSPTKNKSNKSSASATTTSPTPTPHASTSTSTPTPTPTPTPPPAVPSTPVLSSEEIEANFEESQTRWPAFAHLATEDDKKQLYGLYKFILEGPPKPDKDPRDSKDLVKIWKWEAWTEVKCTTGDEAKIEYSNLVFSIGARGGLVQQDVNDEPGNNGPDDAAAMKVATSPSASSPSLSHKNTSLHLNSSTLVERFSNAEKYIKNQGSNLGINTTDLLEFYSYFKQVQKGACNTPEPWAYEMEKKAKWSAWKSLGDMTKEQAMESYVNKVTSVAGAGWEYEEKGSATKGAGAGAGAGRPQGLGLSVSTMSTGQQSNDGTTTNDWKSLEGLHAAAQNGKVEDVKRLLSNGIDINKQNEEGMTAMHWACDGNHSNVVELLLSNNAKHDIQDQEGMSALHYAIPHPNVATLLINAGANVHSQDNEGTSCLDMCDDEDQGPNRILRKDVESLVEKRQ